MQQRYAHGWYHLAFERDLEADVQPVVFGERRLMVVRGADGIGVYDATCPHRGAHLAHGGRVQGNAVFCPFHGYRIGLGCEARGDFRVRAYPTVVVGGMVCARLSDQEVADLPAALGRIAVDHHLVSGFELVAGTSIEMVMENGFDTAHFKVVHGLLAEPDLDIGTGEFGEFAVQGRFHIPRSDWSGGARGPGPVIAEYQARAFSPGVVIAELRGEAPYNYKIITTAVPAPEGAGAVVRLTLALPLGADGQPPDEHFSNALLQASRDGLDKDMAIWNRLCLHSPPNWTERDRPVREFARFCDRFRAGVSPN